MRNTIKEGYVQESGTEETENIDTLTYTSKSAISDKEANRKTQGRGGKGGRTIVKEFKISAE